jgi:hypothetical protein
MATQRQIEANRKNSRHSTGPKEGKSRSRLNATKHGMAGELPEVEAGLSPEFADRRAKWAAEHNPTGESANWALDRAIAATFRIERCERAIDGLIDDTRERATLAWDQDRAVEAAMIFGRIARDPVLASRQLQTTLAGVALLVEAWLGLAAALQVGEWSESEASLALDLLGVDGELRSGRTLLDVPDGSEPLAYRRELVLEEIERLEELHDEAMVPLDERERRRAMAGDAALLSKPAKLLLRYERDAWRRHRESMREVKAKAPEPNVAEPTPAVVEPSWARKQAVAPPSPTFEEERRAVLAEAAPYRQEVVDRLVAMGLVDEDAWLDELERRLEAQYDLAPGRAGATERTQFADVAIGRDS